MTFRDYSKYEVYEDGRIYSYKSKKFLKPGTSTSGYQVVSLSNNEGEIKKYQLHRVVYESFTGEQIPEGLQINHIDECKTNNHINNLNLMTCKENINYGTANLRRGKSVSKSNTNNIKLSTALINNTKLSKQVGAFKNGELIMSFPSIAECGRQGFNSGNVSSCCRGKLKTHKGYEWRYL